MLVRKEFGPTATHTYPKIVNKDILKSAKNFKIEGLDFKLLEFKDKTKNGAIVHYLMAKMVPAPLHHLKRKMWSIWEPFLFS